MLAVELAERAAQIHRAGRERGFGIAEKSAAGDLVTEVDRQAERAIVEGIVAARPHDAILGEEGTAREGSTGTRWVIDPLDGTASYVRGYPTSCVSIGVEVDGSPLVGAVVDAIGRRTDGVVGLGAERDGRPVRMSERTDLARAVIATGFSFDPRIRVAESEVVTRLIDRIADVRRSGSAAFDLCAVATGEVDAYFEIRLAPWDVAGGTAIVRAAGGVVETFDQPDGEVLWVAAPPGLFEPLLGLLRSAGLATG